MTAVSAVASRRNSTGTRLGDTAVLSAITILSVVPYIGRLGFYADDWSILQSFSDRPQDSLLKLASQGFAGRPVQALYSATLFRLFGLTPLGYHLVNAAVLAGCAVLFYLLLVRLRLGRAQSFATAILFIMLPQLSTVRVWYASFQVMLSMGFMLISLHCQLSSARRGRFGSLAAAIVAALVSVGAYEIFAPLIAGFAAALIFLRWRESGQDGKWRIAAAATAVVALVLLAFAYKYIASGRAGSVGDPRRYLLGLRQLVRLDYDWRTDSGLNILATPRAHFVEPILGWWKAAKMLVSGQAGIAVSAVAVITAALVLWQLAGSEQRHGSRSLLFLGIAAFVLGNATFLIVPAVAFTSTGMDNRVQVAAAIGVAMIFVWIIGVAVEAAPIERKAAAFAGVVALISALSVTRIEQIERYWAEAPALQQQVLRAARADLRQLPANSTVILDGVCPYHGPAVVFETSWDIGGALSLALGRPINADAVSPRMSATRTGLSTSIYKQPSFYAYGPDLYAYNPVKHLVVRLDSAGAAAAYFGNRRERACPGYVARGVEV